MKRLLFAFVFIFYSISARAELIEVPHPNPKLFQQKFTMTAYYQGQKSKALIVFIPGGYGQINYDHVKKQDSLWHFDHTLRKMTWNIPNVSEGRFDLVFFDSPYHAGVKGGTHWPQFPFDPGIRASADHAERIQSIIEYYRDKTGLPIILLGHSNGVLSIVYYYNHVIKNEIKIQPDLIVFSAGRWEVSLPDSIITPVIFVHNIKDGCNGTRLEDAKNYYELLIKKDSKRAKFIEIESGVEASDNPCWGNSRHNMYQADNEFISKLSLTLLKFFP